MRCLYCGKELALFKRLRGGEFCSDAHRQRYQEEYTQLALNRLLQANSSKDSKGSKEPSEQDLKASLGKTAVSTNGKEAKPELNKPVAPIESPAIKRRERQKNNEEAPVLAPPAPARGAPLPAAATWPAGLAPDAVAPASASPESMAPAGHAMSTAFVAEEPGEIEEVAAAPDAEPEQVSVAVEEEPPAEPEPPAPPMGGLLVEVPVPIFADVVDICKPESGFSAVGQTMLPQAQQIPAAIERTLDLVGHVDSVLPGELDWLAPRQRALEVREFVRSAPVVEILLKPAGETDLPRFEEPLEISFEPYPVDVAAVLSQEPACEFPPLVLLFRELARLDFEPTVWGETADAEAEVETPRQPVRLAPEQPMPASQTVALESSRMEPVRVDPVHFESPRPRAFHFEPVRVETVFLEPVTAPPEATAAAPEAPAHSAPEETPAPQIPEAVTRPEPVTLHGIAPLRGKLVQVFASVLPREAEIQAPVQSSLPLRPVMVFGPSLPAAAEVKAPSVSEKSVPEKSVPEKSVPEKPEPRVPLPKRKPEVRVLSLPVRSEAKPAEAKITPAQPAPVKPVEAKPLEAPKLENTRLENTRLENTRLENSRPAAAKVKEPQKEAVKKEDLRKPAPVVQQAAPPAEAPYRPAPLNPAAPITDLLGLPTLSLEDSGGFLSRIPMMLRIGIVAAVLAVAVAGIFLTSHGSGATNAKGKVNSPTVVEAGPAIASSDGWIQDWFTDPRGSKNARHIDILRGSLALHDYRLEMEGQIDQGAIGWVFRANNKSFYAEKVAIVKPGLEPTIALVRIAVIDGQEVVREQEPLTLKVHLDTLYKIRVDAVGHRFTTWVQDQQVDEWNDSRIEGGGAGLYYDAGESAHLKGSLSVIPLKEK